MIAEQKAELREQYKKLVAAIPNKAEQSKIIEAKLLKIEAYKEAHSILCYYSRENEVATQNLITIAKETGKEILLSFSREIKIGKYDNPADLIMGEHHIMQPKQSVFEDDVIKIDLVIMPGLAFTKSGKRLGSGSGWYDKFLGMFNFKPFKIGLAFKEQIAEELPQEPHDQKVDLVLST